MLVSEFDFDLPDALIAQEARPRGQSRLLVVRRSEQTWREHAFSELPSLLEPGDLFVANDTRVFPARLLGRRVPSSNTGGARGTPPTGSAECLLLEPEGETEWLALVHPGQKLKPGARVVFDDEARAPGVRIEAEILERRFHGRRLVRFTFSGAPSFGAAVDALGHVPLPPYIHRPDNAADRERYQTVFARHRGSIAAPTAGLHFDDTALSSVRERGIGWETITLHVGYGTFKPVKAERVEDHQVDPERYSISPATAAAIHETRAIGRRVVAVGTTTTRALEHAALATGEVSAGTALASLFIHPGHEFRVIDALLTNFHLPRSSLLMLVAAFAGRELTLEAYRFAVSEGFRFYSYGDAMLIV